MLLETFVCLCDKNRGLRELVASEGENINKNTIGWDNMDKKG